MGMTWDEHARALGIDPATVQVGPHQPVSEAQPTKPAKQAKYHNTPTEYNGRRYDSRREAARAAELDNEMQAGSVRWWLPQPILHLGPARVPYRPDFLVLAKPNWWFEDVKGVDTQRFRDICRLWKAFGPAPLRVLYRDHTVTIPPGVAVRYPDNDLTTGEE